MSAWLNQLLACIAFLPFHIYLFWELPPHCCKRASISESGGYSKLLEIRILLSKPMCMKLKKLMTTPSFYFAFESSGILKLEKKSCKHP